jgi:hypothetical protein
MEKGHGWFMQSFDYQRENDVFFHWLKETFINDPTNPHAGKL